MNVEQIYQIAHRRPVMGRKGRLLAGAFLAPFVAAAASMPAQASDWRLVPSVSFGESFTDNVLLTQTNHQSDWVQSISPRLNLTAAGPRLNLDFIGGVDYLYFDRLNKDSLRPQLLGTATYEAVPDLLRLNVLAEVRRVQIDPAGAFTVSQFNDSPNRQTLQIYSAGPTLYHRFGPVADAQIDYTFSYLSTNQFQTINTIQPQALSNTYLHDVRSSVTSGDRFTTFQWAANVNYIYSHSGITATQPTPFFSKNFQSTLEGSYLLTSSFALVSGIGYDHIRTSGQVANIPTFSGGFRYYGGFELSTPRSRVRFTVGHRFGGLAFDGSASYQYSSRTKMTATYTDEVTTSARRLQALLGLAAQTDFASVFGLDPQFTLNNEAFRSRRGDLALDGQRGRNTFGVDGFAERRTYRILPRSDWIYGGRATWDRQLNRQWQSNFLALYTYQNFNNFVIRRDNIYAAEAGLTDQFARSLKASLTYRFSYRNSSDPLFDIKENAVTLLLTATF